ncbi:MAG TPA: phosphate-binding protein [Chloroflexi bacterium]|nr:phosphate-binding protein [Chloroflexota bacterium]HCU98844.1 phosphate-binding protein [Chloroflexota bacterium]|tara:strand:+ start:14670 stop:15566 length:897 start_codon:yes stop_codon:yes gene_type:complete
MRFIKRNNSTIVLIICVLILSACDKEYSNLQNSDGVDSITLTNKGSDTIVNLALAWSEAYSIINPNISISVTGGGSGTGIAAMINGTVDIANASRKMKEKEYINAKDNGYNPVEYVIARDGIAVIVHPHNPIDQLTLQQLSDIFSGKISNWLDVGGEDRPIVGLSREVNSGTHVYFLEAVVRMGDKSNKTFFSPSTLLLPSSEGITSEISQNPNAIGYDGLGYVTDEVKVVAVSSLDNTNYYVIPTIETVIDNSYPISRALYMYLPGEPTGSHKDYIDWIYTSEAQLIVEELGFVPVN